MAFSINDVQANFRFEGARNTLFKASITNPINSSADQVTEYLVSAAALPESRLGNIGVPYFGRVVNFAGDRTYEPWTVTVMNDEDFKVRNALEEWSNAINKRVENKRSELAAANHNYKSTATVTQLSKTGKELRTYRLNGVYPADISDIRLDWGDFNAFERFNVTFVYDYWEIVNAGLTGTGDAGGIR